MGILDTLGFWPRSEKRPAASSDTEIVRRIAASLDRLEPDRARHLAAFAYLMSRVANADMKISPEETRAMEQAVQKNGGLPEEHAVLVVQMAKTQNVLFGGVDNFLVAREFNKIATRQQKLELLHSLFAVSAADESISSVETGTIRQIASELQIEHPDFIAVKSAYRDHLSVLRKRDEEPRGTGE